MENPRKTNFLAFRLKILDVSHCRACKIVVPAQVERAKLYFGVPKTLINGAPKALVNGVPEPDVTFGPKSQVCEAPLKHQKIKNVKKTKN